MVKEFFMWFALEAMEHVGTTPKRTRGSLTKHSSIRRVARPIPYSDVHRNWHAIHTSPIRMPSPDPVASVSNKILDRVSWSIINYLAKSMLDRTFWGHFRWPTTTYHAPPTKWKNKDDDKPSLQQSLTATCRVMMTLPPSKHHNDSQKVFPPFQGTMLLAL